MKLSVLLVAMVPMVLAAAPKTSVADKAVRGKVTVCKIPWQFKDGDIDWRFNATREKGPLNNEWMWQLNRMSFWRDLADAYGKTKNEKYAKAFARQLKGWLDQTGGIPPESHFNQPDSPFRTIEEGIRLHGSWIDAWHAFKGSPAFTPELKERCLASMRAQAKHLMAHLTAKGNWRLIELSGVYVFATTFPELPESEGYRKQSAQLFADSIREQVLPDGLHYELTPGYHRSVHGNAMPIIRMAKQGGFLNELPADFNDVLLLAAEGPISMMTPAFTPPRFNDSCSPIPTASQIRGALDLFPERQDFLWAATNGKRGTPPKGPLSRFLPWSGFAVMRNGWDGDASYLCFDVGPMGMGHRHQDKLTFVMFKGDEELVFDDGGGQYEKSPERRYGISGYDHSTLLVDGLAQVRNGPLRVEKPIDAEWVSTPEFDRAVGIYDQGFGEEMKPLAKQRREITFDKKNDQFIVKDEVSSSDGQDHEYTLLFQLTTTNTTVSADGTRLVAHYGKHDLELTVEEGGKITTACARREPTLAGWYRVMAGVVPATTAFVTAPKCRDRKFTTRLKAKGRTASVRQQGGAR